MQLRKALQLHDEELTRLRAQTDVLETKEGFFWGARRRKNVDSRYGDIVSQHSPGFFSNLESLFFGRDWIDLDWDVNVAGLGGFGAKRADGNPLGECSRARKTCG